MQLKNGNVVMFLCDRKACGETCPNRECSHTADINHAKNFDFVHIDEKLTDYFEMESDVEDIVRRVLAEEKACKQTSCYTPASAVTVPAVVMANQSAMS